jgi:hypothetical protein
MSPDTGPPSEPTPPPRPVRKPPSAYRPDLRPILILAGVLVLVILGWIVLSPLILPPTVR